MGGTTGGTSEGAAESRSGSAVRDEKIARTLQALALTGPLSYLLMLLFSPLGLTAEASGNTLALGPHEQTVLSALVMGACCLALVLLSRPLENRAGSLAAVGGSACLLSVVGGCLAVGVQASWTPATVAVLLCASSALQFYGAAHAMADVSARSLFVRIAAAMLLAVVVSAASCMFQIAAYGTALVALVMAASAMCPWAARRLADNPQHADSVRGTEPSSETGQHEAERHGKARLGGLAQLCYDWQPLLGGCICALSLGLGWVQGSATGTGATVVIATSGRVLAAALLLGFGLAHARFALSTRAVSAFLFGAGALGILAWTLKDYPAFDAATVAAPGFIQVAVIGVMLAETALTARDTRNPAVLTCMGMTLFLASFLVGLVGGEPIGGTTAGVVIAIAYLAYLCAIFASSLRHAKLAETSGSAEDAEDPESRGANSTARTPGFDDVCRLVAQEYGLSARETEVFPLLVIGLSSAAIGERLFISTQTAKSHKHRIYVKLGVHSHDELSALFSEHSSREGARM